MMVLLKSLARSIDKAVPADAQNPKPDQCWFEPLVQAVISRFRSILKKHSPRMLVGCFDKGVPASKREETEKRDRQRKVLADTVQFDEKTGLWSGAGLPPIQQACEMLVGDRRLRPLFHKWIVHRLFYHGDGQPIDWGSVVMLEYMDGSPSSNNLDGTASPFLEAEHALVAIGKKFPDHVLMVDCDDGDMVPILMRHVVATRQRVIWFKHPKTHSNNEPYIETYDANRFVLGLFDSGYHCLQVELACMLCGNDYAKKDVFSRGIGCKFVLEAVQHCVKAGLCWHTGKLLAEEPKDAVKRVYDWQAAQTPLLESALSELVHICFLAKHIKGGGVKSWYSDAKLVRNNSNEFTCHGLREAFRKFAPAIRAWRGLEWT